MRLLLLLPLLLTLAHAQDIVDLYGDDAEIDWDEQEAIDRELKGKQFPVRHENGELVSWPREIRRMNSMRNNMNAIVDMDWKDPELSELKILYAKWWNCRAFKRLEDFLTEKAYQCTTRDEYGRLFLQVLHVKKHFHYLDEFRPCSVDVKGWPDDDGFLYCIDDKDKYP